MHFFSRLFYRTTRTDIVGGAGVASTTGIVVVVVVVQLSTIIFVHVF